MDFKKKTKLRLVIAIGYIVIGAAFIAASLAGVLERDYFTSFGAVFVILGLSRLIQVLHLMKNADKLQKREIIETDERNVMIWREAQALALSIYLVIAVIAIVVLMIMKMEFAGQIVAYNVAAIIGIYLVCQFFIKRKY